MEAWVLYCKGDKNMHNFKYVTKKEAASYKDELIEFIKAVQNEVRNDFTFRFDFIGSSSRNMITHDENGNIGFDFDVNIEPNDPDEQYSAEEIHKIIFNAMQKHILKLGFFRYNGIYRKVEESTSVITIKSVDRKNSRIKHSCDFAIVHHYNDKGSIHQQYIRFNKNYNTYTWEERGKGFYIDKKIEWLKKHKYWGELCNYYLDKKNNNENPYKHSRSLLAEAVNELYNKYRNK